jgi:SAM-dependent methyltransferase
MTRRDHRPKLDLDTDWGIGESAFTAILEDLRAVRPRRVLEFGSGASSVRLALALPETQIVAIEHAEHFYEKTVRLQTSHDAQINLEIRLRPLRWRLYPRGIFYSYSKVNLRTHVDAVIVDGPPCWTFRGREACLYDIAKHLRVGGRVYLDDFHREAEQAIVRSWLTAFPLAFSLRSLDVGHGIAILEKQKECNAPRLDLLHFLETLRFAYRISKSLVRTRVAHLLRSSGE